MKSVLTEKVLVLNKNWFAIRLKSVLDAIKLVCRERARIVDKSYNTYTWDEWIKLTVEDFDEYISSPNFNVKRPFVIVLTQYNRVPQFDIRLTKRNIYLRDNGICQYSGKKLGKNDYDIDHIKPKSHGGENSWYNLVLCDKKINRQKANKTIEEAGLKLIREPYKPKTNSLFLPPEDEWPEIWKSFIKVSN